MKIIILMVEEVEKILKMGEVKLIENGNMRNVEIGLRNEIRNIENEEDEIDLIDGCIGWIEGEWRRGKDLNMEKRIKVLMSDEKGR